MWVQLQLTQWRLVNQCRPLVVLFFYSFFTPRTMCYTLSSIFSRRRGKFEWVFDTLRYTYYGHKPVQIFMSFAKYYVQKIIIRTQVSCLLRTCWFQKRKYIGTSYSTIFLFYYIRTHPSLNFSSTIKPPQHPPSRNNHHRSRNFPNPIYFSLIFSNTIA